MHQQCDARNCQFHKLSVLSDFFRNSSHTHLHHITNSANQTSPCYPACSHEAEYMTCIKISTAILVCKHTVLKILPTKCGLVVKGHLGQFCILLLPQKPILGNSVSIHGSFHSEVSFGNVKVLTGIASVHVSSLPSEE